MVFQRFFVAASIVLLTLAQASAWASGGGCMNSGGGGAAAAAGGGAGGVPSMLPNGYRAQGQSVGAGEDAQRQAYQAQQQYQAAQQQYQAAQRLQAQRYQTQQYAPQQSWDSSTEVIGENQREESAKTAPPSAVKALLSTEEAAKEQANRIPAGGCAVCDEAGQSSDMSKVCCPGITASKPTGASGGTPSTPLKQSDL